MPAPYNVIPPIVAGYELDNYRVAVIRAKAGENIIINPSFETGTTRWDTFSGTATRVTTHQRRGLYSLRMTPTSGVNDGFVSYLVALTAGVTYFFSFDFLGAPGVTYRANFGVNGTNAPLSRLHKWTGTGHWQRIWVSYVETSSASRRLTIRKNNHASVSPFYVDGAQLEVDRLTTYIDGDQRGLVKDQRAYYWLATPHASISRRIAATRAGGEEVDLKTLGFHITALIGFGLGAVENYTLPNASLGGSFYQRSVVTESILDIAGTFSVGREDPTELGRRRKELNALLRPSAAIVKQPVVLRAYTTDGCGNDVGEPVDIPCLYQDGNRGNRNNYYQEGAVLSFKTFLPYLGHMDGNAGTLLDYEDDFTAAYHAALIDGDWQALSTGFNDPVFSTAVDPQRGRVYFGGEFTTAGGVTVNGITYWDRATQTFVAMGGGIASGVLGFDPYVKTIRVAANGDVWIGGNFLQVGSGLVATKGLARWNIASGTWTAFNITTTLFAAINWIEIDDDGLVYVSGVFLNWNSNGDSDNIVSYNGATWSPLGTGINGSAVNALEWVNGYLYAGGNFADAGGVSGTQHIAYWDKAGATWGSMIGADGPVYALLEMPDGSLIVGGNFSSLGTTGLANVGQWYGAGPYGFFGALGAGVNGVVYSLTLMSDGTVIVSGDFTEASFIPIIDRLAIWTGTAFLPLDIDLPGSGGVITGSVLGDDLYIGVAATGTATAAGLTTIINHGSADAYPRITFTGPGRLDKLKSYTNGITLAFDLLLQAGEVAVLDLDPSNVTFTSTFRGNILGTILPGSTPAMFLIAPGENQLRFYLTGDSAATLAVLEYQPVYEALDDALYP